MADEDILESRAEYVAILKLLDDQTKAIMLKFLFTVENNLLQDDLQQIDKVMLDKAIKTLRKQYTELIKSSIGKAVDSGVKTKEIEFEKYLSKVEKAINGQKITDIEKKAITSEIKVQFGGGLEAKVVDSVWNKVWPDALNVDDRIARLSAKVKQFTEQTIKQGIITGESAANMAKTLRDHFEIEGLERKAAFRLAAHTTNMVYQSTQAEISMQAKFVMGIRIVRGMYGRISPNCPICGEHGGDSSREYYKSDFGGRDIDLWVMANMPPYHSHCNCGIEQITEDAATFVENARKEFASENNKAYTVSNTPKQFRGHKLPDKDQKPNTVLDHIGKNGDVKTRRFFDIGGDLKLDIHLAHSGAKHTFPHAHDWENGKRINIRELTDKEYLMIKDLIGEVRR